ncbi:MAG TPA: LysM domain-containing protein [Gemmatimonadales bacterium]|nr:LysM domain-containing protein [Gemmatimonadales bacterium]
MRRTTISRSSSAWVLGIGLVVCSAPLGAQDSLQTAPTGRVHVVQQGETLWGLAQLYLNDPLMWPEIYRLNTDVVEDPHWIFPGEQLVLGDLAPAPVVAEAAPVEPQPGEPPVAEPVAQQPQQMPGQLPPVDTTQPPLEPPAVEAAAPPPPPPPADAGAPTIFARAARAGPPTVIGGSGLGYRPVQWGEFYSAGWLTERESLPWARVLGDARQPPSVRGVSTSSATVFEEVEITPPSGAMYQVGDSLLVAHLGREVPEWGRVVIPGGVVRVTHVAEGSVLAAVVAQFGRVVDGQVALPLERFTPAPAAPPVPVSNGIMGTVLAVRDFHYVPNQQDVVFLDQGREAGVVPGDVFELIREADPATGAPPERGAVLQVVHVRQRSASAVITHIYRPGVRAGQAVRLIRKMPA